MKLQIFIFLTFTSLFFISELSNSQIIRKTIQADTIALTGSDRIDKDRNDFMSTQKPTTEMRIECILCKGTTVLNYRNGYNGTSYLIRCWRCAGKGYIISPSGKRSEFFK